MEGGRSHSTGGSHGDALLSAVCTIVSRSGIFPESDNFVFEFIYFGLFLCRPFGLGWRLDELPRRTCEGTSFAQEISEFPCGTLSLAKLNV